VIGPIKEVKPALWTGVREDGLHFVLERIDAGVEHSESRRAFWTAFCEDEFRAERDYRAFFEKADASMKARLPLKYESGNWNAWDGLSGFQANLQEPHARNELWVAFVTSEPVESAGKVTGPEVEMYVSVASVKGSPMLMNMGIQRGFQYLVQATRNLDDPNHRCHRNLALSLHSFVAQVMAEREPGLLYMITKPVDRMRELLLQALPRDTFHGCTYSQAQEAYYQAGTPSAEWLELDQEYARLMGAATSACSDQGQMKGLIKPLEQAPQRDEGRLEVLKILQRSIDAERTRLVDQARRVLERQAQQRLLEISRLAEAIQVRPDGTPIAISRYPEEVIRIHGRSERSDKAFEWNRTTRTIHVGGRTLVGDDTKAYDWFVQSIMGGDTPFVTVNLDALAALSKPATGS
jgi:hypothetical protein